MFTPASPPQAAKRPSLLAQMASRLGTPTSGRHRRAQGVAERRTQGPGRGP